LASFTQAPASSAEAIEGGSISMAAKKEQWPKAAPPFPASEDNVVNGPWGRAIEAGTIRLS
jgi:hypothetical protein